ncbi:MAG: DUF4382 domain-containing protein [Candidatus Palauibacterales bacterium]|nr:DUF4382 domain-containing protein [Candidatus Palauibacterales bacterium]
MTDAQKTPVLSSSLLRLGAALAVATALPVLAACEGDSAVGPGASGNYQINLARSDDGGGAVQSNVSAEEAGIRAARLSRESVEAVTIDLEAVEVYRLNADTTGSDTTQGPDARWVRVEVVSDSASSDSADDSSSLEVDLTDLPDDSTGIEVAAGDLEAGTYRGLRLRFSGAELVLADSARLGGGDGGVTYGPGTYDLFVPSGVQTGIKLPSVRFTMTTDGSETTTVLADTDASIQNINITGRGFLMTPVLKTAAEDSAATDDSASSDGS